MNPGQEEVRPWPRWLRYPVAAVLVVAASYGLARVVTAGTDSAVLRVVVAAVLIPALLAPVQFWGRRRRAARRPARRPSSGAGGAHGYAAGRGLYAEALAVAGELRGAGRSAWADTVEHAVSGATGSGAALVELRWALGSVLDQEPRLEAPLRRPIRSLHAEIAALLAAS